MVCFTYLQNITCSQTYSQAQLDDIAHERTIVCSQLFANLVPRGRDPFSRRQRSPLPVPLDKATRTLGTRLVICRLLGGLSADEKEKNSTE